MSDLCLKLCFPSPVVLLSLAGLIPCAAPAQSMPGVPWPAADGLGRQLPLEGEAPAARGDRRVGMFYFLWLGPHAVPGSPFDISRILAQDPQAMQKPDSPLWGPMHAPHHWGESVFGHYRGDDPYVLRRHAQMLADAGVDTVIFDVTNQLTYPENYRALMETWAAVRKDGGRTPQTAFLCPFGDPARVVRELYAALYKPGLHRDLWFQWKGKPLIMADPARLGADDATAREIREFFTFRAPQPDYFQGPTRPDMWSWLEVHPQHVFRNAAGESEQMSVGVAQNAVAGRLGSMSESAGACGRTWHKGARDVSPGAVERGPNFTEQWARARKEDPQFVFVTGWNEWIAGRFAEFNKVREPVMFVDQFSQEYSRDIEPMKGGHGDHYYWQLISEVRRYKGVPALPAPAAPGIPQDAAAWLARQPEFRDDAGDTAHRDHPGYADPLRYRNTLGRNDFISAKTAHDASRLVFRMTTREPVTPAGSDGWMWLLLDSDSNPATGWNGIDFIINRGAPAEGRAVIERHTGSASAWTWERAGEAVLTVTGPDLELAVPAAVLGLPAGKDWQIDFQWADNVPENADPAAWLDAGDTAPAGRFRYRYRALAGK